MESKRQRSRTSSGIRWHTEDLELLLEEVINRIIKDPNSFETPTSIKFYTSIIENNVGLRKYSWVSMRDKMKNVKAKYKQAIEWREQNGQEEEFDSTITDSINKICPYFEQLDAIFGDRKPVNIIRSPIKIQQKNQKPKINTELTYLQQLETDRLLYKKAKLDIEEKKFDFEKEKFERTFALEERRLKMEEKKIAEELKLKNIENEDNKELELIKIKLQHELELKKLELSLK
ncbi:uncharacterized protein LOC119669351 isoform X1 [Teleopsis dalmanni]|uniref:uncharacterized protein LOC119669351 isoform X1 n=1 Tax=Teleopsis dalmanni TaxID=139649 RepID=UPI0018CF882C|nr:uncharacterized protein LOC119669351 isoform X1 [Teleopsis dalmanni]